MATFERRIPCDLAVHDAAGRILAVFEVKRRLRADATWAREWRDAMLVGRTLVDAPTFLVLPDRIYRWPAMAPAAAEPDWSTDGTPLLRPYFERLRISPAEVANGVFESIVEMWLQDLVRGTQGGPRELVEALRGGEVVSHVAA